MGKKIRIVHIAQAAGGVERYLQMLLKYVDKEKYENILVCSHDYDAHKFEGLVERIEPLDMQRSIGIHDISTIVRVRRLIKECHPDIVYAHSSKAGAVARIARVGMKCKCIYNPHGWAFNMQVSRKKRALYVAIEKLLAPLCDRIICISNAEKRSALKRKICCEDKLQIVINGIDTAEYKYSTETPKRKELRIPEDAFVVGMVGRLSEQKAPDMFIRAAEIIKKRIPSAFFVIVGSGDLRYDVEKYAAEHGFSDSLLITGWIDDPMKYIKQFDVAVLLSRWEGFGLVLAEYMLAKKPVIATSVDAIPDIITHGENGLLVKKDDYIAAANAAIKIHEDPELTEKLISQGFTRVCECFDIKRVAREHEEAWSRL